MRTRSRNPKYNLQQEFDRDIRPHILQFGASSGDVEKCRELHFSLRTNDENILIKHYNRPNMSPLRSNLCENERNAVFSIVLMAEVQRDSRYLDEKIGDQQFTYSISGRLSSHAESCLNTFQEWQVNTGINIEVDQKRDNAIRFIKNIHRRLNYMFRNSSMPLGSRRQLGDMSRKQELVDMFKAMETHYGLNVPSGLIQHIFSLLLEVDQHPSGTLKYPNPVNDRPELIRACHLEIVLAVSKHMYPELKFTRPKVGNATEACFGWRPKSSNSKRMYGDLAAYVLREIRKDFEDVRK